MTDTDDRTPNADDRSRDYTTMTDTTDTDTDTTETNTDTDTDTTETNTDTDTGASRPTANRTDERSTGDGTPRTAEATGSTDESRRTTSAQTVFQRGGGHPSDARTVVDGPGAPTDTDDTGLADREETAGTDGDDDQTGGTTDGDETSGGRPTAQSVFDRGGEPPV